MIISVKIKRLEDKELAYIDSLCEAAPATNKYLQRPINYEMLVGTHIPNPFQHRLGALVALLLKDPAVVDVAIWQNDAGDWIADAFVEVGRGHCLRRGEAANPITAFVNLIYEIQRY